MASSAISSLLVNDRRKAGKWTRCVYHKQRVEIGSHRVALRDRDDWCKIFLLLDVVLCVVDVVVVEKVCPAPESLARDECLAICRCTDQREGRCGYERKSSPGSEHQGLCTTRYVLLYSYCCTATAVHAAAVLRTDAPCGRHLIITTRYPFH